MSNSPLLLVGELVVDFTLPSSRNETKVRLGGVAHAARGLWAANIEFAAAVVCPQYLVAEAERYLENHGCKKFVWLGNVEGAPNVIGIGDVREVGHQGYEDLLRDQKQVVIRDVGEALRHYTEVMVFPGRFNVGEISTLFAELAKFSFDIAYDLKSLAGLEMFKGRIRALMLSTSSDLFVEKASDGIDDLLSDLKEIAAETFLLKENRGGSRLFDFSSGEVMEIPAILGNTENSVGVGDVYSAVMVGSLGKGWKEAAWRGAYAATHYSQTTYPDDFKRAVQRDLTLSLETIQALGGTILPWHERGAYQAYLAAPDFSYIDTPEIESVVEAFSYHNLSLRRPVQENGELTPGSDLSIMQAAYAKDVSLLEECDVVVAVPLERDPGTLAEIGMALALGKPVITFDPRSENNNTMIMAGSHTYTDDLDICLNAAFNIFSSLRRHRR